MIKVSVIVPVYNVEKYLAKCLDSLVNQTLKDIEIIVVNDGSTDDSQKIIDKYSKKYKQIKAYKKENGGLSSARNYGLKKVSGEYIAFVDSDDYVDKKMLEIMYQKITTDKLDIIACDILNVYENGKKESIKSNYHFSSDNVKNYLLAPAAACNKLYSSKLIDKINFKKGIYYEDLELIPKLVKYTNKIGFIEKDLYFYFQRNGSQMRELKFCDNLLDIFTVLESNKKELYTKYKEEVEYMYITHLLRTATLRFLDYPNTDIYLKKINNEIKNNFPNWNKNIYLKKSSLKTKVICYLAYYKQYRFLKIIKKITKK